jgi:molybdopterin/thiamine biosynthesis adenylyltransferase
MKGFMMSAATKFEFEKAFSRNLGLVSEAEQAALRKTCVALPGLGGVGGAHLQALARMGIGSFRLADPDTFDVVNFNRQLGATTETIGRNKAEVMEQTLLTINPDAIVDTIPSGVSSENAERFLYGVDVVVDGIEFFCIEARRMLYRECRARGIPVVTAGPIGYGAALLVFMPDGMTFDAYFGIVDSMTRAEQLLAFGLGLGPGLAGDLDPSRIDFEGEKGPALGAACFLCAAVAATEVLKLVTGRGKLASVPNGVYFDPFRGQTMPLKPNAADAETWVGIRTQCFQRFPALQAMHERELAETHFNALSSIAVGEMIESNS